MTQYIPTIQVKSSSSSFFSAFTLALPFVLPQGLDPNPNIFSSGRFVYRLAYTLKNINASQSPILNRIYLQNGIPILLDVPQGLDLNKYTFVMIDPHCNGTSTEYLINFTQVQ